MPNPKKPTHLKAIQGTQRKDRDNPAEPVVSGGRPTAPEHLSPMEAEKFDELAGYLEGMRVLSVEDRDALAALSVVLVEIQEDQILLNSEGAYYVPNLDNPIVRAHPAVQRLASNRQRAQALLGEFGLTPASRSKVSAKGQGEENPFGALDGMRA